MAVVEGLDFRDRAVYLPEVDGLVLADLHLGRAARSRVELPLGERAGIVDRLRALLDRFEPGEVVLAGDVLDAFSTVPEGVREALRTIQSAVGEAGADLTLVTGNHDPMLGELVESVDEYRLDGLTVVCHGHVIPEGRGDRYLIGHDHPAIVIEGRRRPCFLFEQGGYEGGDVVMLPAFNQLLAGTPVNRVTADRIQSPLLSSLDGVRPIVHDPEADETLTFPPLGAMKKFL